MVEACVRDFMTAPVVTEGPEASMTVLSAVLRLRRISAVPIVDKGALVGVVSTTDILRAPETARAKDVMSTHLVLAYPDEPLDDASRRLVAGRVHRVVAVDRKTQTKVTGVLAACDVLRAVKARRIVEPISAIMTTPVETIDVGDSVDEACDALAHSNVHGLVVVDGGSPIGVFTHAEALAARRLPRSLRKSPVEDLVNYETICLDTLTPIYRAAAYVSSMNVRRVLVVEKRRLIGIISCLDLVDVLARAPESVS